jgi:hypothetical protein
MAFALTLPNSKVEYKLRSLVEYQDVYDTTTKKIKITGIIRYHYHSEADLPESFPCRLLPMFRLFQLIDGLSAAITRGGVSADFIVRDTVIEVTERNLRPQYNGTWLIDLYTGDRKRVQ